MTVAEMSIDKLVRTLSMRTVDVAWVHGEYLEYADFWKLLKQGTGVGVLKLKV